jgi:hypothetical protein
MKKQPELLHFTSTVARGTRHWFASTCLHGVAGLAQAREVRMTPRECLYLLKGSKRGPLEVRHGVLNQAGIEVLD